MGWLWGGIGLSETGWDWDWVVWDGDWVGWNGDWVGWGGSESNGVG